MRNLKRRLLINALAHIHILHFRIALLDNLLRRIVPIIQHTVIQRLQTPAQPRAHAAPFPRLVRRADVRLVVMRHRIRGVDLVGYVRLRVDEELAPG